MWWLRPQSQCWYGEVMWGGCWHCWPDWRQLYDTDFAKLLVSLPFYCVSTEKVFTTLHVNWVVNINNKISLTNKTNLSGKFELPFLCDTVLLVSLPHIHWKGNMFSKRTTEVFIFDLVCTEQHIPAPWGYPWWRGPARWWWWWWRCSAWMEGMAWLRFRLGQRPHHNRLSLWRITSIWSSSPSRRTSRPPRIAISATGSLRMLRRVPFEALVHFFLKSLENSSILHETTEILQNCYGSCLALLPLLPNFIIS